MDIVRGAPKDTWGFSYICGGFLICFFFAALHKIRLCARITPNALSARPAIFLLCAAGARLLLVRGPLHSAPSAREKCCAHLWRKCCVLFQTQKEPRDLYRSTRYGGYSMFACWCTPPQAVSLHRMANESFWGWGAKPPRCARTSTLCLGCLAALCKVSR